MGDFKIVELAKITTNEEELIQIMQEVFDLLNPDDWKFLETILINKKPEATENVWLAFREFDTEMKFENLHGVFEVFCGKIPKRIDMRQGEFAKVYQITKLFFPWGYYLVSLKARCGHDHYALPFTELNMGLPEFGWHSPTISLRSNIPGPTDYSFVAEPIINLLRNRGFNIKGRT